MLMELLVATFGKVLYSISVSYVQSKKQSVESSQPFWLLSLFEFCLRPLFFCSLGLSIQPSAPPKDPMLGTFF